MYPMRSEELQYLSLDLCVLIYHLEQLRVQQVILMASV